MNFEDFFSERTGHRSPRQWQCELAADPIVRSRLLRRVTGDGKTEGVLTAWLWNSLAHPDKEVRRAWPRRLVWCLPMRVLVEQTVAVAETLCETLPELDRPKVALLMGGEDTEEWFLEPDRSWILVGTQDMLLSRALNRGYASGRARWPVEFGLLSQDCLWVLDEVQLMDVGLATSAQLQAYRDQDADKALKPAHTWWMSATLQPDWLKSVDTIERHSQWTKYISFANSVERNGGLWEVRKTIDVTEIASTDHDAFATRILKEHVTSEPGEYGRITLVVCNTVDRAVATYKAVRASGVVDDIRLVHSRFRPAERESWREDFLNRSACTDHIDRIIIATQVVEAGVDISATCLVTELAPWPGLVQRFGRCARYGGEGRVVIVDRGHDEKTSAPYVPETLESTLAAVKQLNDVGTRSLEAFEEHLDTGGRARLYPYSPAHLLMRGEFEELFDTTPDLTGADLDISRFIRTGEERDLQVFWVDLANDEKPDDNRKPLRRELCSVPFLKARDWLCGKETKSNRKPRLQKRMRAWVWDFIDGEWKEAQRADLLPGQTVAVAAACGGYDIEMGFDADSTAAVSIVTDVPIDDAKEELDAADSTHDSEALSHCHWQSIAFHTQQVVHQVEAICEAFQLEPPLAHVLKLAARWHDIGKAHPAFQGAIEDTAEDPRPKRIDLAKGPPSAWRTPNRNMYRFAIDNERFEYRASLRHELASALAMFAILRAYKPEHPALLGPWKEVFQQLAIATPSPRKAVQPPTMEIQEILELSADEFDLMVYLIASHHGKVRVALHASPADQDYVSRDENGLPIRGVRNGDILPPVAITPGGDAQPELTLTLEPAAMGLSPVTGMSWRERCERLIRRHSPATLAALEAILRAADVHASRLPVEDPEFAKVTN